MEKKKTCTLKNVETFKNLLKNSKKSMEIMKARTKL